MVKDKKLIQNYGHKILEAGFTSIPNLLLENQEALKLNDNELLFYIKCYMIHSKRYIKNSDLKMACSGRTIQRIKISLTEKGYLTSKELYLKDKKGKIIGIGTGYDWTGLIKALDDIPTSQNDQDEPPDKPKCQSTDQLDLAPAETADTTTTKEVVEKEVVVNEKLPFKKFEDRYFEILKTKCSLKIQYNYKRNRNLLRPLLSDYPMDTLFKILDIFFEDQWAKKKGYDLGIFRQDFNGFLIQLENSPDVTKGFGYKNPQP